MITTTFKPLFATVCWKPSTYFKYYKDSYD